MGDAIKYDCVDIVDLLLRRGWVDVRSWEFNGFTALHFAGLGGNRAIISRLLEAEADINAGDCEGHTLLDYLDMVIDKDLATFLVGHGTRLGARGNSKRMFNSKFEKNIRMKFTKKVEWEEK